MILLQSVPNQNTSILKSTIKMTKPIDINPSQSNAYYNNNNHQRRRSFYDDYTIEHHTLMSGYSSQQQNPFNQLRTAFSPSQHHQSQHHSMLASPPLSPVLNTQFPASSAIRSKSAPSTNTQPIEESQKVRHHVRRPSVAIKFSEEDEILHDMKSGIRDRRDSFMRRPPSPIAECILKGDFSF